MRNKKIVVFVVLVGLIIVSKIGISYAYWRFSYMQTDKNIGINKCLTISLSEENNEINLNNIYPISDEEGGNLTPYSFKLTNTCSMSAEYLLNLNCLKINDFFTVKDKINGNGALTYPVALLNEDEYIAANRSKYNNRNMYLTINRWWWIFSVYYFEGYGIRFQRVRPEEYLSLGDYASQNDGVRSVINLKQNSLVLGDGTINNPYTVE